MSLVAQAKSGFVWTTINTIVIRGGLFLIQMWMAAKLGRSVFDIVGLMSIFILIGTALVDGGFKYSIIRKPNLRPIELDSVFYGNLLFSLVIYLISFFLAPVTAIYFKVPELTLYIRVYTLIFFVNAFSTVQIAILQKNLKFKSITIISLVSFFFSSVASIYMVYAGYKVWSIIALQLIQATATTFLSWIIASWMPRLRFSWPYFLEHFKFGFNLSLNSILTSGYNSSFNFLIGSVQLNKLGYYERSDALNRYPVTVLTTIVTKVSFPIMSKFSENLEQVRTVFKYLLFLLFVITGPLIAFFFLEAESILILLGEEWLEAVPYFKLLALTSLFYPVYNLNLNLLILFDKTKLLLRIEIIKKVIFLSIIGLLAILNYSILTILLVNVFFSSISYLINAYYTQRTIEVPLYEQGLMLLKLALIIGAVSVLYCLIQIDISYVPSVQLILKAIVFIVLLYPVIYIFYKDKISKLISLLRNRAL